MRKGQLLLLPLLLILPGVAGAQVSSKVDTTSFVVVGDGLAAGMGNFSLQEVFQRDSFPAVMARQMETAFPLPYIQAPGIGSVPGFPAQPVSVPAPGQTTVRTPFPPPLFVFNLAVPGHRVADALGLRPVAPLVHQNNAKQTVTNMILGFPALILGPKKPLWSQVEYAVAMNPTMVLVELGYTEAIEAAAAGNAALMPDPAAFRTNYAKVLSTLKPTFATIITTTIPNPVDTAYFNSVAAVSRLIGVESSKLVTKYGLKDGDLLSPNAVFSASVEDDQLPEGSVVSAAAAAAITSRVRALNTEILAASREAGALSYDLYATIARLRASGLNTAGLNLTADFLGGLYTLSGFYPGTTVHALIANEILTQLNQTFRESFATVNLSQVAPDDPAVRFRPYAVPGGSK